LIIGLLLLWPAGHRALPDHNNDREDRVFQRNIIAHFCRDYRRKFSCSGRQRDQPGLIVIDINAL
jgi:hypothetical protein